MRPFFLPILVCSAFLQVSCGLLPAHRTAAILNDVNSFINDRPDSALTVLNSVDTSRFFPSRLKARYFLLRAIALDKNYLDDGSLVSEMNWVAKWYSLHGNSENKQLSYYYLADQQKDCGENTEASVNFSRALDLAVKRQDSFIEGMALRNLADLYTSSHDYAQSLEYTRRSVDAFERAGRPVHALYSRLMLALHFYNNRLFDRCISLSDSVYNEAISQKQTIMAADAQIISARAFVLSKTPVPDSTITRMKRASSYISLNAQNKAIYAWALCLKGNIKDAELELAEAYSVAKDEKDSLLVMPWDARIAESTNNLVHKVRIQEDMLLYTNKQIQVSVQRSVDKIRVQYYQNQESAISQALQRERYFTAGLSVFALAVIAFLYLILRIRRIREEQEAREQRTRLEEKEQANRILSDKLDLYGSTVGETLDFGFEVLNRLSDAYYHPNTARENVFRSIIKEYLEDVSSRSQLSDSIETNINIIHDNVLSKLRAEVPSLKEVDIKLFSYCLFGFSYKAINAFYPGSSSLNTSYSRVFRLRKAIQNSGSQYTDFFLSFLTRSVPNRLKKDVE